MNAEPSDVRPTRHSIRALWRALVRFEPRKIVPEIAFRNTIGFTCAVIVGTVLESPSTGVIAGLGALNVCYSDGLDPYLFRARRMLAATLLVGAAVVFGGISAHSGAAAVAVATLWAFAAGMLVALGTTAADLGVITLVTLVVFAAKPMSIPEAVEAGAVAMAGGLIQTLLSTFLWPIRRHEPERRIIAQIYSALARVAEAPPPAAKAPPMTRQISDAQDAFAPLARDHSVEAERNVFLLVQAERIRLSLLNAGRLQRRIARYDGSAAAADALTQILNRAGSALQLIGQRILYGETAGSTDAVMAPLTAGLIELGALAVPDGNAFFAALVRDARRQTVALRSQIRAAAWAGSGTRNLLKERAQVTPPDTAEGVVPPMSGALSGGSCAPSPANSGPGAERSDDDGPWRVRFQGYRARLLANLSLDSTVFRHAVRMALCLALGDTLGRGLGLQRTYWIPMTIAIVLKPDFTGTFARGVLRIAGTMAGLVVATVLFRFVHAGVATDIALMALFTLLLRWAGPANYGIFVIAVSALVVLLAAVVGVAPGDVIAARALNTALGGGLALFAYAVWPTWERTQTRTALADMLDAYREYVHAVFGVWQGEPLASIERVRVKGRRARSNAQASVDRLCGEPGVTARQVNSIDTILVHSHTFVHAAMAMESRLYRNPRDQAPPWMPAFAGSVDRALTTLSGVLRNPDQPPAAGARRSRVDVDTPLPGKGGNELLETEADRMRTSLRSLGEELGRRDWL